MLSSNHSDFEAKPTKQPFELYNTCKEFFS